MELIANVQECLGFQTVLNLIIPLSNPLGITHQIIGLSDEKKMSILCDALKLQGTKRALVVHGLDGQEMISLSTPSKIFELNDGWIKSYIFNPESIGLSLVKEDELVLKENENVKKITLEILAGKEGPRSDLAYLNAAFALYLYGLANNVKEGYLLAKKMVKAKKALEILEKIKKLSND